MYFKIVHECFSTVCRQDSEDVRLKFIKCSDNMKEITGINHIHTRKFTVCFDI